MNCRSNLLNIVSGKVLANQLSAAGRNADGHYEAANILGHTNISTTVKYSHLANDQVTDRSYRNRPQRRSDVSLVIKPICQEQAHS